jgi:guanylate kinase
MPAPLLVVISGPSGVGKDAVMSALLARDPRLRRSITMTTRAPRDLEVDGVHYDFATLAEFEARVQAGELLEHASVHGNRYGSPRRRVRELLEAGHDVLLQVDVQGSLALREVVPGALFIYLAPGDPAALEARIRERRPDAATLAARNADRERELAAQARFEHVVVNHEGALDATIDAVAGIIEAERARLERAPIEV